jgi:hypothetical protein
MCYHSQTRIDEGGDNMAEKIESKTIKAGSITYFLDLKETKEGKPFLVITESRFKGEDQERERSSILLFPEHIHDFLKAFQEISQNMA